MSFPYPQYTYSPSSLESDALNTSESDALNTSRSRLVLRPVTESEEHATEGGIILPGFPNGDKLRGPLPRIEVMDPPANRLINLIKAHYPAYEKRMPLPDHVRHAMQMIQYCHTEALGGHVERCPDGHISRVFYNRCGHRFCPRCAGRQRRQWLRERRAKHLPVRHDHVVFTIPHAFNDVWRLNFARMGDLLFHTSTDSLRALLADPKRLGAEPGMTVTLETWDDRLFFHPHVHGLVTGGGLTPKGEWVDVANPHCLVAVKPLMWEFRKRFCQALKELLKKALLEQEQTQEGATPKKQDTLTLPQGTTPRQWLNRVNKGNRQDWDVFISKPPEDGGPTTRDLETYQSDAVAGGPLVAVRLEPNSEPYFVPEAIMSPDPLPAPQPDLDVSSAQIAYLKSAPMSASRLKDTQEDPQKDPQKQDSQVTFRWGVYDPNTGKRERDRTEPLPVDAFLRRLVQHGPPSRYQTVRHYGLYAAAKKEAYEHCREGLSDREPEPLPPDSEDEATDTDAWIAQHTCPVCNKPLIVSSSIPSSVTGRSIPRVPIGHVYAPHSSLGGGHDP